MKSEIAKVGVGGSNPLARSNFPFEEISGGSRGWVVAGAAGARPASPPLSDF
jgi:hypothetical protein